MRRTERTGFTLVELMVAIAIMALVMTALLGTIQGTIQARDEAEIEIASVRDGLACWSGNLLLSAIGVGLLAFVVRR